MTDEKCGEMVLTYRQRKFLDLYMKYGNATEAAIRAGYSEKRATAIGLKNLIKLRNYIDRMRRCKKC